MAPVSEMRVRDNSPSTQILVPYRPQVCVENGLEIHLAGIINTIGELPPLQRRRPVRLNREMPRQVEHIGICVWIFPMQQQDRCICIERSPIVRELRWHEAHSNGNGE